MTRLDDRMIDSQPFIRRKATADTLRKISAWEIWEFSQPNYHHVYDRSVSLYVHQGNATVAFTDSDSVELQSGDFLTIKQGAQATWSISKPVRNSYCYHDTFTSATSRCDQVRWFNKNDK